MKILFFVLCLFVTKMTLAGHESGNGGDVVRCRDHSGNDDFQLLDYYEANLNPPYFNSALSDPSLVTMDSKVRFILQRLQKLDPKRGQRYLTLYETFFFPKNISWVEGFTLPPTGDAGYIPLTGSCYEIERVVIQRPPIYPGQTLFVVKSDIWRRLSPEVQAGLVLHELIYHEGLQVGHSNSIKTRMFNAFISSSEFDGVSLGEYEEFSRRIFNTPDLLMFRNETFELAYSSKDVILIDSNELLASKNNPLNLSWFVYGLPKGFKLNNLTGILRAAEVPPGKYEMTLVVRQGNFHAHTKVVFYIYPEAKPPVVWKLGSLFVKITKPSIKHSFSLENLVFSSSGKKPQFIFAEKEPDFLELHRDGLLTIHPNHHERVTKHEFRILVFPETDESNTTPILMTVSYGK